MGIEAIRGQAFQTQKDPRFGRLNDLAPFPVAVMKYRDKSNLIEREFEATVHCGMEVKQLVTWYLWPSSREQ